MPKTAAAILCLALAVAPTVALANEDVTLEELVVETASTPAQNAALGRYYQGKAAAARAEASRHDRMGRAYSSGKLPQRDRMKKHCENISEQYMKAAAEYDELAELHDEEAKK